jgi:hypothetical protein
VRDISNTVDSCLFLCNNLIFVFYVDNGIIIATHQDIITPFVQELRNAELDLDVEADCARYLGVNIAPCSDGSLLLSQTGLIEWILVDLELSDSASSKLTPAVALIGKSCIFISLLSFDSCSCVSFYNMGYYPHPDSPSTSIPGNWNA